MPGDIWLTFPDGTEYELRESVTIGRNAKNDLTFESPTVSREHATVAFRDGRWYIEDRGSFNGTFLNGTRVQSGSPLPLRHADRIGIGAETFLFSWPAAESPGSAAGSKESEGAEAPSRPPLRRQNLGIPRVTRSSGVDDPSHRGAS